jgi:DDE superfamily endonuclease
MWEHSSANLISIEQHLTEIRKLLEDVPLKNIWILDETALQHSMTDLHSNVTIISDGCGVKCSKEIIMMTPIVSVSGEKLIPQVIRKSKQPFVLKGIDIDKKYQVKYDFQSKAWQDGSSMLLLFHQIAGVAQSCKSKFYLMLDYCSSYVWTAKNLILKDCK